MESTVCNLCGADRPRRLYRRFERDISRCGECGLVYAGPQRLTREETWARYNPHYFRDEYLRSYSVTDDRLDLESFDELHGRVLDLLRPHRQCGALLEIGCGAGFFLKAAERDGWTVTGLEVMAAGVEFARTRLDLTVMPSAIEEADLPTGSFDVVAMFEVLEHLSDPLGALRRTRTLLRPGGCLALSTPNIKALSHTVLGRDWAVLNPLEHLYYFSETTLTAALRRAGYEEVRFDRHYTVGEYETMLPTHTFDADHWRARFYVWLLRTRGGRLRHPVQALGLADGLHCIARSRE